MIKTNGIDKNEFLIYKGRPLVRKGDDLYYGEMSDKYHVFMMIMSTTGSIKENVEVPNLIMVQLIEKNESTPKKQVTSKSFSDALETADAWLTRYNSKV